MEILIVCINEQIKSTQISVIKFENRKYVIVFTRDLFGSCGNNQMRAMIYQMDFLPFQTRTIEYLIYFDCLERIRQV